MNFKNKLWDNRIKGKAGRQENKEKKGGGRRRDLTMEVDGINVYKGQK